MSDVQFEDEVDVESQFQNRQVAQGPKGLAGLIIKLGLVKTERGANLLLIFFAVIFFILAFFVPQLLALPDQSKGEPYQGAVITV